MAGNNLRPDRPRNRIARIAIYAKTSSEVIAALDGELNNSSSAKLAANGLYAFPRYFDNGFHDITTSTKPIHCR